MKRSEKRIGDDDEDGKNQVETPRKKLENIC